MKKCHVTAVIIIEIIIATNIIGHQGGKRAGTRVTPSMGQWLRVEGMVLGVGKTLAGIITLLKAEFYGLLRGNKRFSARHV